METLEQEAAGLLYSGVIASFIGSGINGNLTVLAVKANA